jgi:hypothetical protein
MNTVKLRYKGAVYVVTLLSGRLHDRSGLTFLGALTGIMTGG